MKLGSLFSGIGGFDFGFERAGFAVAWQCEIDPHASAVLARHWPHVRRYADVCALSGAEVEPVDIIAFGSPCQDLSVAGKRAGMAGARSGLFFEATRIITEMRAATDGRFPIIALWENVPGAFCSAGGADFGAALDALAGSGAVDIAWRVINAGHWVPQRRRRVFTLALYPPASDGCAGIGRAAEILFEPEGVRGDIAARRTAGEDVAGTLGGGTGNRGWCGDLDRCGAFVVVNDGHQGVRGDGSDNLIASIQDARELADKQQNGIGVGAASEPMYTLDGVSQHAIAYVPEMVGTLSGGAHPGGLNGQDAFTQVIAPTGRVRRLTPAECERLQGFPDGWTAGQSDSHRYRQLGNAVVPHVAEWIAQRMPI